MIERSLETKLLFAETFIALTEEMPLEKITITTIVEKLNKNRNTFYYHFPDREYLITWIFRYDLDCFLQKTFPPHQLVYENEDTGTFPEYAFYVFIEKDNRHLYHAPFFEAFACCLEQRHDYYKKTLRRTEEPCLRNYLVQLYKPQLKKDIVFMLGDKHLELKKLDFLAEFYTKAFLYQIIDKLSSVDGCRTNNAMVPFENVIHDSLFLLIHEKAHELREHYQA
ncbi:MAG: TetR/AcrR family transcriptional regulator C-terminal domain-containing protein [Raoultibacter sp.]